MLRHVEAQALPPPFVDVRACESLGTGTYHLRIETSGGVFVLDSYSQKQNRAEHSLPSVRGQAGRRLVQTSRWTGCYDGNVEQGLIVCAALAGGVSCVGPIEIGRTYAGHVGGKADGHPTQPQTLFQYTPRPLAGDVLALDPVRKRRDLDLSGSWKLTFEPAKPAPPK